MELSGQRHTPAAVPLRQTPVRIENEAGWAQNGSGRLEKREKSLIPAGVCTPHRPVRSLVAVPITLSHLLPCLPSVRLFSLKSTMF
jgi:hypothetical protein